MKSKIKLLFVLSFIAFGLTTSYAQPAEPGDWSKVRLYGHAFKNEDFTDAQYDFIIKNIGLFTVEKRHARDIYGAINTEDAAEGTAARIHAGNPKCKVLIYWSTNTAYTAYYTTIAAAITANPDWVDVTDSRYTYSEECKDFWVNEANTIVTTRGLDGVFGDGAPGAESRGYIGAVTENLGALSALSCFNVYNGYRVSSPTKIYSGSATLANSNGVFIEAFFRDPCDTKEEAVFLMDQLLAIPSNKYIICRGASGVFGTTHEFSLASYLIVANDYSYFSWGGEDNSYAGDGTMTYWHSDFEQEIGEPLGVATKNGYVYKRVFKHCTVTVDFENATSSIIWNQNNSIEPTPEDENLALNGTATQSTTAYSGEASRAIDGNTSGLWTDASISHTGAATGEWWKVTLDNSYTINSINVYNRTDAGYLVRLSNFTIQVLDSSGQITFTQTISNAPNPSVTIQTNGVIGNQVRILQNKATTPLALAEVEVYGSSTTLSTNSELTKNNSLFSISPNPVKDILNIKLKTNDPATYRVFDTTGQLLLTGTFKNSTTTVDFSSLTQGIYILKVSNGTTAATQKIIKE